MEAQATTPSDRSPGPLGEGVRTCRPAVVRPVRAHGTGSEAPAAPAGAPADWNIIRGED